jgi:hypothetical protein
MELARGCNPVMELAQGWSLPGDGILSGDGAYPGMELAPSAHLTQDGTYPGMELARRWNLLGMVLTRWCLPGDGTCPGITRGGLPGDGMQWGCLPGGPSYPAMPPAIRFASRPSPDLTRPCPPAPTTPPANPFCQRGLPGCTPAEAPGNHRVI